MKQSRNETRERTPNRASRRSVMGAARPPQRATPPRWTVELAPPLRDSVPLSETSFRGSTLGGGG